jgi:hypothetical protein
VADHGAATGLCHGGYGLACIDPGPTTLSSQALEPIGNAAQKRHPLPLDAVG